MARNFSLKFLLASSSLASLLVGLDFAITNTTAKAQDPQVVTCPIPGATNANGCLNGQGASFAYPFLQDLAPNLAAPLTNRVNYTSTGSGAGRTGFLAQSSTRVSSPFVFGVSEAPLTNTQINQYYFGTDNSEGGIPGRYETGYGAPVQVPLFAGAVTVSYNVDGVAANLQLTRAEYCSLFNDVAGARAATLPAGLQTATGARRSDSSGTSFVFTSHMAEVCTPIGEWETAQGTSRGDGAVAVRESDSVQSNLAVTPNTFTVVLDNGSTVASDSTGDFAPNGTTPIAIPAGRVRLCDAEDIEFEPDTAVQNRSGNGLDATCFPDAIIPANTNFNVAAQVNGASVPPTTPPSPQPAPVAGTNRFGYVEVANATESGYNLNTALLQNPNVGAAAFFAATSANVTTALSTIDANADDRDPATCRVAYEESDPADGYPISGLVYGLFYGDYNPNVVPPLSAEVPNTGAPSGPRPTAFSNRGVSLQGGVQNFLVQIYGADARLAGLGYASLSNAIETRTRNLLFVTRCVRNDSGTNPLDPLPTSTQTNQANLNPAQPAGSQGLLSQ